MLTTYNTTLPERVIVTRPGRRRSGLNQAQVSDRLGISQSDVSKLERRTDIRGSTLRDYLRAVEARLRLVAIDDAGEVELGLPESRR